MIELVNYINWIIIIIFKTLDVMKIVFSNMTLGDIANVAATIILGVLGYSYTQFQDRKEENQSKVERLAQYQSIITIDDNQNSNIKLDIETWHNYTNYFYMNVLKTKSKELKNGLTSAFNLEVTFKSLCNVIPNEIRIKKIVMYDTYKDVKENNSDQIVLNFYNEEYQFKTLAFDNNKLLPMKCLCCINEDEYNKMLKHNFTNKYMNFQIIYEVKNQFNVITELNTRALFEISDFIDVGSNNNGGQKIQTDLKLVYAYSNINNVYEE